MPDDTIRCHLEEEMVSRAMKPVKNCRYVETGGGERKSLLRAGENMNLPPEEM
jgi:hypothetical protein